MLMFRLTLGEMTAIKRFQLGWNGSSVTFEVKATIGCLWILLLGITWFGL